MAINGRIELEDLVIEFTGVESVIDFTGVESDRCMVRVTGECGSSEYFCASRDLTKALAIALHHDGMPSWEDDYEGAERAQPSHPGLRFIP